MTDTKRLPAHSLKIGAAIVAAWVAFEGFSPTPYIPTKGDVPTIGNGSTHYEDGTRVTMQDKPITRQRAEELTVNLLEKTYGECVRHSLGSTLVHQVEFAQAVDFAGQYGCRTWETSSMLRLTKAGDYRAACGAYLRYRFAAGYDCSTPGNTRCYGVWTRQKARYAACMGVQ